MKVYDQPSQNFKVCDVVEFVGIFSASPMLSTGNQHFLLLDSKDQRNDGTDDDRDSNFCRFIPPASAVPRLHVITFRRLTSTCSLVPSPSTPLFENKVALKLVFLFVVTLNICQ